MSSNEGLKQFIIEWNNLFPLDRWWREKYKIPFGSSAHLEANQADILLEFIEAQLFEEQTITVLEKIKKKTLYEKGEWISKNDIAEEVSDEDFDNIVI